MTADTPIRNSFRRRLFAIVVASFVVVGVIAWIGRPTGVGPAEGTALLGPPAAAPVGDTLRLGTFNIDGGQGTDDQVDLARTAKCLQRLDVIGLQEVHGFAADPPNQAVTLGGLLRLPYLYVPSERRWGHESFGNAFFTDLPVLHWARVVVPSAPFHARRNYLLSELEWQGHPLHVLTTHVDFKANGDEQLAILINTFLAQPTPAILMGDLNHPASSPQIRALLATPGVEEAVSRVLDPVEGRVDWIFLRGLHTVDAGSVDLGASDHPAYWAAVRLATSPSTTRAAVAPQGHPSP
jgi:endonuclease/exonuclease/phosphatase family metal-dependent hydrolase